MNPDAIWNVLNNAVAAGGVPGVATAVSDARGTLFEAAAGVTMLGGEQKVDADTLFWIASMTKPVTSLAAMQLVEQGRLDLDAPVGDLLPELKHPRILEGGKLRPARRPITLRHLLTHTAGFSYAFASAEYAAYLTAQPNPPAFGTRAALDAPLLFEPGERWEYGLGVDWAGLAVEAASGLNLEAYFQKHIFGPLGMADTSFMPTAAQLARRAALHKRQADGSLAATPPAALTVPEVFSGGGGLYSTLRGYQKFLRVFLTAGAGIVTAGTITEMTRNQIGGLRAGYLPSANPALFVGADVNPGQHNQWGLGFIIYPGKGRFGRNAGSFGWAGMANTYFWVDPAAKLAAVMMMQILPSGDAGAMKTLIGFERAMYAMPQ
ncbi:serine hydrolase [Acidocella sp.]|uniref:serine hydrolase domain-containing protein n=1 Tax=Acidocella sp. TaxID=50710 RepID=UPI002634B3D9|nr:serine hydrolase domain-containing protein [Acidocella sp.]MDD2794687.1 serine hydrolase [Acidocella sp.]